MLEDRETCLFIVSLMLPLEQATIAASRQAGSPNSSTAQQQTATTQASVSPSCPEGSVCQGLVFAADLEGRLCHQWAFIALK